MSVNSKKIFYSMGEVAEMFDVNPSLIRYWESKFSIIAPGKNSAGKRTFTTKDIDNIKIIYHLVKEKGMTLEGAQKQLKENKSNVKRDMEVVEKLHSIRAVLMQIRQELKDGESAIDSDEVHYEPVVIAEPEPETVVEPSVEVEPVVEPEPQPELEPEIVSVEPEKQGYTDLFGNTYESQPEPQQGKESQSISEEYTPQPRIVEQMLF